MKYLIALILAASSSAAYADNPCKTGKPDVFKFVSWDVKQTGDNVVSIKLTFQNTLNQTLITATMGAAVNDKDGRPIENLSFHTEDDVKAASEHTETFEYQDFPAEDVARLQGTTPVLCAWSALDDTRKDLDFMTK